LLQAHACMQRALPGLLEPLLQQQLLAVLLPLWVLAWWAELVEELLQVTRLSRSAACTP